MLEAVVVMLLQHPQVLDVDVDVMRWTGGRPRRDVMRMGMQRRTQQIEHQHPQQDPMTDASADRRRRFRGGRRKVFDHGVD